MGAPDKYYVVIEGRWVEVEAKLYVHPFKLMDCNSTPNKRKLFVKNGNARKKGTTR